MIVIIQNVVYFGECPVDTVAAAFGVGEVGRWEGGDMDNCFESVRLLLWAMV